MSKRKLFVGFVVLLLSLVSCTSIPRESDMMLCVGETDPKGRTEIECSPNKECIGPISAFVVKGVPGDTATAICGNESITCTVAAGDTMCSRTSPKPKEKAIPGCRGVGPFYCSYTDP